MKRQGMSVTINELIELAHDLKKEAIDLRNNLGMSTEDIGNQKFQINIINKTEESDGWSIEK